MRFITWNLNSIKTSFDKSSDLAMLVSELTPDILIFNETKITEDKIPTYSVKFPDYKYQYWNCSTTKKGYSGTALLSKISPISTVFTIHDRITIEEEDLATLIQMEKEGRIILAEYETFYLLGAYVPNSGDKLVRLVDRINVWEEYIRKTIQELQKDKPVIYTGDLNVAHEEIDLANPKTNQNTAGFTKAERLAFVKMLKDCDLVDSYRHLFPKKIEYSFFSNFHKSRERNIGWRIDYFLVPIGMADKIRDCQIMNRYFGSDHVPILLDLDF